MIVIPAMDLFKNRIVRLLKGNINDITYYNLNPLDQAIMFSRLGFKKIHIVDLFGAIYGNIICFDFLKTLKDASSIEIQFGGGIRNISVLDKLFLIGIDKIIIGSMAINDKPLFESILKSFSPNSFIVSVDVRDKMVAFNGWTKISDVPLFEHIDYCKSFGITEFLCTDISKDGTLKGPNSLLYSEIIDAYPEIKLIASGGIKDLQDINILKELKLFGAVTGKAIYEKNIDLEELSKLTV